MKKVIATTLFFIGFLFFRLSPAQAATLYYNAATNTNWSTLTNWWTNSGFSVQAGSLPDDGDDVIISGNVFSNSGAAASVNTMTVNGTAQIRIPVTVAGGATFNDTSLNRQSPVVGLNQMSRGWNAMAAAPDGDIYSAVSGGDIYKQTLGSGDFTALSQTNRSWTGMAAAPNGNIYAAVNVGDIYMQTNGSGNFNALSQTSRFWRGMAVDPIDGDVYAATSSGDIYKQALGSGNFVALGQTSRDWTGMAAAPNGDIYATVYGGDIYKQTSGSGNFVALNQVNTNWTGIAAAPNGDIYASNGGDLYKQTGGTGDFFSLGQTDIAGNWFSLTVAPNGNLYTATANGDIYMRVESSIVNGEITGEVTFNDSSQNRSTVIGDTIFNDASSNYVGSTVSGDAIFNDSSYSYGIVSGDATFFNNSNNGFTVEGSAIFYGSSYNAYKINTDAEFYDSTENTSSGIVLGNACFATTATNNGTVSGGPPTVCSASIPAVTTSSTTLAVNPTTSVLFGEVEATGGTSVTERGFEYGLTDSYGSSKSSSGTFNAETFNAVVGSLTCDTTYHFRAFATNSEGTDYGDDETFTSDACAGNSSTLYGVDGSGSNGDDPNLYTLDPASGDILTTIGPTGYYITGLAFHPTSEILYGVTGGADPTHSKSLLTINKTSAVSTWLGTIKDSGNTARVMPDISFRSNGGLYGLSNDGKLYTIDVTSCNGTSDTNCLATVVGNPGISGSGNGLAFNSVDELFFFGDEDETYYQLNPDTGLEITNPNFLNPSGELPAINAATFNDNDVLFASRLNFGDSPSDLIIIDTDTDTIISTSDGDNPDMLYMDAIAFYLPPPTAPTITTTPASSITETTATLNGNITDTGGADIDERGFNWGLSDSYGTNVIQNTGPYSTGAFSTSLTGLTCDTTYHFRAYAINEVDTANGSDLTFTTDECPSSVSGSSPKKTTVVPVSLPPVISVTTSTPTVPICTINLTLRYGSRGEEVKCLQTLLNQKNTANLVIDGMFGPKTRAAVILFQLQRKLVGDGIVGPITRLTLSLK